MKQIFRYFLLGLGAAAGLSACNKEGGAVPDATSLHVDFHVMTDLNVVKSAALSDENKVTTIDLFAFDAASGLLEVMQRDIPAKAPSDAGVAGEKKVGDVSLSFGKGGAKKILTIANTAANRVELPASLEAGVTTYAQMLESVVRLPEGNGAPSSPFVMTGYANDVQTGTGSVTVSLCRKVARFDIVNQTPGDASEGLVVSKLQLQSVPAHAYLFKDGYNASEADARVDYPAAIPSTPGIDATYYVLPVPEAEKMQLLVEGTLHGEAFAQTLDIQPQDVSGTPQGVKPNYRYTVKLDGKSKEVQLSVTVSTVEEWTPGGDISGTITGGGSTGGDITFNGLKWMDRNLGATTADFRIDWDGGIGSFYQWGRNTAFAATGFTTVSGPLSGLDEANSDANKDKFIAGGFKDWLSSSDNGLWQTPESQPCPEGYRMPTNAELQGIFPASGVLFNMRSMTVKTGEAVAGGSMTAHYWGDNGAKTLYGIKNQGTASACYMKWEYLTTGAGKSYLRISRWSADAAATFTDKDLNTVKGEFAAMPAATEVFELPGAGYITGSNGTYSNPPTGGFYWSSSLDGSGKVYRAEIQEGHVNMTEPYASRASGHSIRCVRQ